MFADGRGLLRDTPKAIQGCRKAAESAAPDAAMSLGHFFEHGVGVPTDKEPAIELYRRAAILFDKPSRTEDAAAAIRPLEGLANHHPAVLVLAARFRAATGAWVRPLGSVAAGFPRRNYRRYQSRHDR
jgi:TPR repeat protein